VAKLLPGASVHAFEPLPNVVRYLRRNVASIANVHVYPLAVGAREGDLTMHINTHTHSSSGLRLGTALAAFPEAKEVGTATVRISTLNAILKDVVMQHPILLLKLDVQGYEAGSLGATWQTPKCVDHVVLETPFKPMYLRSSLCTMVSWCSRTYWISCVRTGFTSCARSLG